MLCASAQVYHQEVTQRLHTQRVQSVDDIEWLRVMRFYSEGDVVGASCTFRMQPAPCTLRLHPCARSPHRRFARALVAPAIQWSLHSSARQEA